MVTLILVLLPLTANIQPIRIHQEPDGRGK